MRRRTGGHAAGARGVRRPAHQGHGDRPRSAAFIGSMNLDPRSEMFNSEMGVIIDSPALAKSWRSAWNATWTAPTAGRSVRADDGALRWRSSAGRADLAAGARLQAARGERDVQGFAGRSLLICPSHDPTSDLAFIADCLAVAALLAGCAGFVPQPGPGRRARRQLPAADHALRRRGRHAGASGPPAIRCTTTTARWMPMSK